jgi:excisionase family DNA binding protein
MSPLSTKQVAERLGLSPSTLERWLAKGKVQRPKSLTVGENVFRNWTDADIERVKKYKQEHYWTGQGRKPKAKQ